MAAAAAPGSGAPTTESFILKLTRHVDDYLSEHIEDEDWRRFARVMEESEEHGMDPMSVLRCVVRKHWSEQHQVGEGTALDEAADKHQVTLDEAAFDNYDILYPESIVGFEWFVRKCKQTLLLILKLQEVCNNVEGLCRAFTPEHVSLVVEGAAKKGQEQFDFALDKLDTDGRAMYARKGMRRGSCGSNAGGLHKPLLEDKWLRWCDTGRGGYWVADTNREGTAEGTWRLASALVTDNGVWEQVPEREQEPQPAAHEPPAVSARIESCGLRMVSKMQIVELREEAVFRGGAGGEGANRTLKDIADQLCCTLAGPLEGDHVLVERACQILDSLKKVVKVLGLKQEQHQQDQPSRVCRRDSALKLAEDRPAQLFHDLLHLSNFADNDVLAALRQLLPEYDEADRKKEPIAQCMTLNRRLLELSDLHNVEETFLPRLFHRFCLFAWQEMHPKQTLYLDLGGSSSLKEDKEGQRLAEKGDQQVRFVVVSDTHGWDSDLELPEGDVLLHCGNLLFEAGHNTGTTSSDLEAAMGLFATSRYKKFQWIIMVGGNHDQPLFDLWHRDPEKLFQLLPDNLLLLQAHTDFPDRRTLCSGAAKRKENRECIQEGAVWLQPTCGQTGQGYKVNLELRNPLHKGRDGRDDVGWVIAGTGVSLAKDQWSANRAFQIVRPEVGQEGDLQKAAAKVLLEHDPYIVMSHGPPEAQSEELSHGRSEGAGDGSLWKALKECNSWKVAIFGHNLEEHGLLRHTLGDRLLVGAATSTPLFVPSRPPIVFDLDFDWDKVGTCTREQHHVQQCWQWPCLRWQWWKEQCGLHELFLPLRKCWNSLELKCCYDEGDTEELLAEWVPKWFVAKPVLDILAEEQAKLEEEGKTGDARLSDFHVSGPALLYSFQVVVHWFIALIVTFVAYNLTGNRSSYVLLQSKPREECVTVQSSPVQGCDAIVDYPNWLWIFILPTFFHTWIVQMRCLSYVILPQVHTLGRGFRLFNMRVSFRFWLCLMFAWSAISLTDVTAQCLLYAQFLVSLRFNQQISALWKVTIGQSLWSALPLVSDIFGLFTLCWLMTFAQAFFMLLHIFPTHAEGVSYGFKSMAKGYTTLASHLFRFHIDYQLSSSSTSNWSPSHQGSSRSFWRLLSWSNDQTNNHLHQRSSWRLVSWISDKTNKRLFWHADILRTQAFYGRMPALVWEESQIMKMRAQKEFEKKILVRYLQILFHRQSDFLFRLIWVDLLEKYLKLEVQISLFAIDLALHPDQTSKWKDANKQMCFAIGVTFVSVFYAVYTHFFVLRYLWSVTYNLDDIQWLHREEGARNLQLFNRWRLAYSALFLCLSVGVFHCALKFYKAFHCEFSLYNFGGCVELEYRGPSYNRTLILPDG